MQRHVITALRLSLLLLGSTALAAITPLGPWTTGIATNYGGAADGMDPYSPSFGTAVVRPCRHNVLGLKASCLHTQTAASVTATCSCFFGCMSSFGTAVVRLALCSL